MIAFAAVAVTIASGLVIYHHFDRWLRDRKRRNRYRVTDLRK